jgi:PAS domain S-box-containing protein
VNSINVSTTQQPLSPAEELSEVVALVEAARENGSDAKVPGHDTRIRQAEARTDEANTRTAEVEARSVQALLVSELRYRRLFEAAQDGILILDVDTGRITDVNPFLTKLLGFSHAEMVGHTVGELSPFKDIESNTIMLDRLQRDRYVRYEDLPLETKNGTRIAVEFVSNVYQSGESDVIQCNIRDITERKAAESRMRESEERLRAMTSSIRDYSIIVLDTIGSILTWNLGAETIKGWLAEEIVGQHFSLFYMPEDIADGKPDRNLLEAAMTGRVEDEGWRIRKAKTRFWANVVISALRNPEGRVTGFVKVTRDLTERKKAEDDIRLLNAELEERVIQRTAQLEDANKELQAFSYSVSHDLRAPLRHVLGFVDLLKTGVGPSLSEKNLRYMATISGAATRMGTLIDDLLTFSRIGRSEMRTTDVDLGQLVQETLEGLHEDTNGRTIQWKIHPLPSVQADRSLLRMVLVNLMSNAVKFTGKRAQAIIEIGDVPSENGETAIFIRDNGAGFDPKYISNLFGVFQRLHRQDEFEGTGIGLANVQRIIFRHGGRTWAEGIVDGGATFFFTLPNHQ